MKEHVKDFQNWKQSKIYERTRIRSSRKDKLNEWINFKDDLEVFVDPKNIIHDYDLFEPEFRNLVMMSEYDPEEQKQSYDPLQYNKLASKLNRLEL